jgi:hypothetical protein
MEAELRVCVLPPDCAERCLAPAHSLELSVAGIDLRRTPDGAWYCFEVNPSPASATTRQRPGNRLPTRLRHSWCRERPGTSRHPIGPGRRMQIFDPLIKSPVAVVCCGNAGGECSNSAPLGPPARPRQALSADLWAQRNPNKYGASRLASPGMQTPESLPGDLIRNKATGARGRFDRFVTMPKKRWCGSGGR